MVMLKADNQKLGIPPKPKLTHGDSTSYQKLHLTEFLKPNQASQLESTQGKHMIRILDTTKKFVRKF